MAIICKLREYKADVEPDYGNALRPAGLISAILVAAVALFMAFSFTGGAPRTEALAVNGPASPKAGAPVRTETRFLTKNWKDLEPGLKSEPAREPGVQDLTAPEWEGREVFKDLKAMAVYEVKDAPRGDEEARKFAAMLQQGGTL